MKEFKYIFEISESMHS